MTVHAPHCQAAIDDTSGSPERCPACQASWLVCGRYRLTGELGRGGMGVVYGARDVERDIAVAVKTVAIGGADDADWKGYELFERSSRMLQHLEHAGLPTVYAFAQDERGAFLLVREAFDGGTLVDRLAACGGALPRERLEPLLERLLELLDFLQTRQPPIVHRDIKPSNIMFRAQDDWQPVWSTSTPWPRRPAKERG